VDTLAFKSDDLLQPEELLQAWNTWVAELPELYRITLPRCYFPTTMDQLDMIQDMSMRFVMHLRLEHCPDMAPVKLVSKSS